MRIGVLRERKPDETRVALTPREVAVLAGRGHTVDVEPGAGVAAGYPDAAFVRAGATLSPKAQILAACRLLLKVKAPLPEEYEDYAPHHILMTFLHFDENIDPACLARLVSRGFLGIACEAVRVSGRAPILEPMSRLTGHLFAQRAIELCTRHSGRLAPGLDPALGQVGALLIGTGEVGLSVLQVWRALRLRLTVLANRDRDAVNAEANHRFGTRDRDYLPADEVTFLQMDVTDPARTQAALAAALPSVAIVVNAAVRRSSLPRDRLAHLITRPMLAALAPGSIVCDATACDRDLIETCVSSPDLAAVETIDGIIHYSPDHIPALVPGTASDLYAAALLPFALALAEKGVAGALRPGTPLHGAIACGAGRLTDTRSAARKNLLASPIDSALAAWSADAGERGMAPSPPLLVTPGPVATSKAVRAAMALDRSAAEPGMIEALRQMQAQVGALVRMDAAYAVIPVPGSATQANEMVLRALPPPGAAVLIVTNGAYGDWLAHLCATMGRPHHVLRTPPLEPIRPERIARALEDDPAISHVAVVHVETSSGRLNPLPEIASLCRRLGRGLIVDAVASAAIVPLDVAHDRPEALVLSSNKGLQGPPGLAWVVAERAALERGRGFAASASLDLFDQHQHVERTGTFRFTPPTHVLCGVHAALEELAAEGFAARTARYGENWGAAAAILSGAGFPPLLRLPDAAPIVVTVALPEDGLAPAAVTEAMANRGYVLVPGRLAVPRTVRLGCIGALTPADTARAAAALAEVLRSGPIIA